MNPSDVAVDMIALGADALCEAVPKMPRHEAVAMAAVVLAATFPASAALVAEQAHERAQKAHYAGPVAAVREYAAELRAQATDPKS